MSIQSVSGNRDSASTLESSLSKLEKLTSDYESDLDDIQTRLSRLESAINHFGCSTCIKKLGDTKNFVRWDVTYIQANIPEIVDVKRCIASLLMEIESFKEQYGTLKGKDKTLELLADRLEKYQKKINKALSDDKLKQTAVSSMVATFASNKYDAKNGDYIPKEKVSTALDSWEGDLKFVRQDNGTYLVIKVGKDGSEVPMGYTTKKGKNAYYEKATKKVLKSEKEKNSTSSNEKTTSDKFENVTSASNKSTTSKSESSSTNYVSSSEIKKKMKSTFLSSNLSDDEKSIISEKMAKDLKKKNISLSDLKSKNKSELKDYDYYYNVVGENGKKYVKVEASRMGSTGGRERIFTSKYEIGADTTLRDAAHSNGLGKSYTPK